MASVKSSVQDRRAAPDLNISLASNNPFRVAAAASPSSLSPQVASPGTAQQISTPKRISTNPFLDSAGMDLAQPPQVTRSPPKPMPPPGTRPAPRKPVANGDAAELLAGMTLTEKPISDRNVPPRGTQQRTGGPANGHRPGWSAEEERRVRQDRPRRDKNSELDIFADSNERENRRPSHQRRNSDTSVLDVKDDERRRRERKYADKDPKSRSRRPPDPRYYKPKKRNEQLDLIDKLDVTSIYGMGLFHHDGPFDACNPHRNRKGLNGAPMQAFPEGSSNNALAGPIPSRMDYDRFHGRGAEGFSDYSTAPQLQQQQYYPSRTSQERTKPKRPGINRDDSFDPKYAEQIHGPQSAGLGTSTFLEGTPAPRQVLQRRESETADDNGAPPQGLNRKKSISQKLRAGMSTRRRAGTNEAGRVTSPEGRYQYGERTMSDETPPPPATQSAGGRARLEAPIEINPFFNNPYNTEEMRNETKKTVDVEERDVSMELPRPKTAGSPGRSGFDGENAGAESKPVGLLNRVKSLKGGRRNKPERDRSGSDAANNNPTSATATAPGMAL